jgi:hypothetical protein
MQIATKRKTPKRKTPKRKTPKRKTPKRKTPKRKTPKRKTPKRKTPKRRNTLKPNIMKGGVAIYFYDTNDKKQHTTSPEMEGLFNLKEDRKNSVSHEKLQLGRLEGDRTYSILKSNPGVYGKHTLQQLGTLHKDTSIITINAVDVDVIQQYVLIDMVYTKNKSYPPTYIMKPYSKL